MTLIVIYKEWVGLAISALLLWVVSKMVLARRIRIQEKQKKIVVLTGSDQTTRESIVSAAQQGLRTVHFLMQQANIAMLKIWSILISKAPKAKIMGGPCNFLNLGEVWNLLHSNTVMVILTCCATILAVVPFKFLLISLLLYGFLTTSSLGKRMQSDQGNRRLVRLYSNHPCRSCG